MEEPHATFIPHSHPFAHARLLNVVCRVSDLERTVKVSSVYVCVCMYRKVKGTGSERVYVVSVSVTPRLHSTHPLAPHKLLPSPNDVNSSTSP